MQIGNHWCDVAAKNSTQSWIALRDVRIRINKERPASLCGDSSMSGIMLPVETLSPPKQELWQSGAHPEVNEKMA